jgi:hypothetical protein
MPRVTPEYEFRPFACPFVCPFVCRFVCQRVACVGSDGILVTLLILSRHTLLLMGGSMGLEAALAADEKLVCAQHASIESYYD